MAVYPFMTINDDIEVVHTELRADILSEMARVLGTTIDYLLNGEKKENETINQVVQIMEELSPELQKVALAQVRVLLGLYQQNNKQMF